MAKKVIKVLIRIIAVLLAFVLLNLLFIPKYIEKNQDGRLTAEYYREKTPIDVIFVGSSTVEAGISPMVLYRDYGITAYDRSNASQVIQLSYYLIEEAIKRNKPELVVLEVGFIYPDADYVDEGASRKSLDYMKWSKSKVDCINAMMGEQEHFIDYVFPILRFHSRWNDLTTEDLKYWVYKPSVTLNGQLLAFDGLDGADITYDPYGLEAGQLACEQNISYLQKVCDVCKENDVQLMLIKLPLVRGNWNHEIDAQVADVASKNGVNYVNYIDEFDSIGLDAKNDYGDNQHMNYYGAEKFTTILGSYIRENYTVSDRSNDAKVKKVFDKKLDNYNTLAQNKVPGFIKK